MNETPRPFVSTFILMIISPLITLASVTLYSLADVHNTYDILVPIIGIGQLICIIGLFVGKMWGLIGYTFIVSALTIATFAYYVPKDEISAAIKTSVVFIPLVLLAIYYWTLKRSYFK